MRGKTWKSCIQTQKEENNQISREATSGSKCLSKVFLGLKETEVDSTPLNYRALQDQIYGMSDSLSSQCHNEL